MKKRARPAQKRLPPALNDVLCLADPDAGVNRAELTVTVVEAKALRYTPAGLPALEMVLQHESEVQQAGHPRRVELTLNAMALGDIALLLADISLGTQLSVMGFLAPSRKGSTRLVLHIQQASRISMVGDPVVV